MNVLFLTHRLPFSPNRGDRVRAYFLLRHLRRIADVHVVSLVHDEDEASHVNDLSGLAASVRIAHVPRRRNIARSLLALPTRQPTTHTMLDSPEFSRAIDAAVATHRPDVVLAYCSGTAKWAMQAPLSRLPLVIDLVDVDSAKWHDLAQVSDMPLRWVYQREARLLGSFEATAAERASATMVVTARERDALRELSSTARIEVVPNGVEVSALRPSAPPVDGPSAVFCGVMNYAPNEHAATLLGRDVWPLVRTNRPDATLTIVGSQPTPAVLALGDSTRGIIVTGAVPDVKPYLWNAAIGVAPILTARGIQNKVLEAVAAGLPAVVTPNIAAALPAEVLPAVVSASGVRGLADAILGLFAKTAAERRAMAERADVQALAWDRQLAPVGPLLREAAASGRTEASRS